MTTKPAKLSPLDRALALQRKGDLEGAEAAFRAALKGDPDNPDVLVLLGDMLRNADRAAEAVEILARAIGVAQGRNRPVSPAWRVALAYAKRDSGDLDGALAIIDALVTAAPGVPEPLFLRAQLLQRMERHEAALRDYEAVLARAPAYAQALNNIGISYQALGRLKEAFDAFAKAMETNPKYVQAIVNAAQLQLDMGQAETAIANLRRACALEPDNGLAEAALIDALQVGEKPEEAEKLAERALQRSPQDPDAMIRLGNIQMVMGRRDPAVGLARRAKELQPGAPGVLALLAEADREADLDALLGEIDNVLGAGQGYGRTISLHFAAARLCEKLKRYPQAFSHYIDGNAARRDQLARLERSYDRDRVERQVDGLVEAFPADSFEGPVGSASQLPVFIVGMPRSGTTLTEQILASHPQVAGAGELTEVSQIVRWLRAEHGYPARLSVATLQKGANGYLNHVGRIGRGAARVTDKMPGNYMHLGLIARMFPKARIVHCRRDPMDNCLSCFAQNFRADGLAWSTDLRDLGHQYCQYSRLMDHWRKVLPAGRMLEIDYEDTVADLEGQARRLVEFAGLDWDPACLDFHKTERAVATASREQVRNPIYRSSVGRWKRYGDGVAPLVEALGACGRGPAAR